MSLLEVKEVLRRFQIVVYTGNRMDDLILMEQELDDLYHEQLIERDEYFKLKAILRREMQEMNT
jgi:uncharacterized protein YqgQ